MSNHSNVKPFIQSSSSEELIRIELSQQQAQMKYPNLAVGSIISIETAEYTNQNAEAINAMVQVRVQNIFSSPSN